MTGELLAKQLGYTAFSFAKNLEEVSHDDSLTQPQAFGNCMNWVVGHIVYHRNVIHRVLGIDPVAPADAVERYARGSKPLTAADDATSIDTLKSLFEKSQDVLIPYLENLSDDELHRNADDAPLAIKVAGLVFHESYHMGQLGLIRRVMGKASTLV